MYIGGSAHYKCQWWWWWGKLSGREKCPGNVRGGMSREKRPALRTPIIMAPADANVRCTQDCCVWPVNECCSFSFIDSLMTSAKQSLTSSVQVCKSELCRVWMVQSAYRCVSLSSVECFLFITFDGWMRVLPLMSVMCCLTSENGPRTLSQFGIASGTRLKCDDFLQEFNIVVDVCHV